MNHTHLQVESVDRLARPARSAHGLAGRRGCGWPLILTNRNGDWRSGVVRVSVCLCAMTGLLSGLAGPPAQVGGDGGSIAALLLIPSSSWRISRWSSPERSLLTRTTAFHGLTWPWQRLPVAVQVEARHHDDGWNSVSCLAFSLLSYFHCCLARPFRHEVSLQGGEWGPHLSSHEQLSCVACGEAGSGSVAH